MLRQYGDFNVFQLMRLLLADPDCSLPPEQRLRFRADLSAAFPAREFAQVGVRASQADASAQEVIEIRTANFCIASILGPLPEPFTEWVRDLARERNPAMADFFDIFNQRLNLLRFAFKREQITALNSDAPEQTEEAHALASLMGLASPHLAQQIPLDPRRWLGLAGLLANRRKCASNVEQILTLVMNMQFGKRQPAIKVSLQALIGAWAQIEPEDRIGLGRSNHALGCSSVLGKRVWDQQARVRLLIASLDFEAMCALLPPNAQELAQSVRVFANQAAPAESGAQEAPRPGYAHFSALLLLLLDRQVDCEVEIQVRQDSIPLSLLQTGEPGLRLGHTSWLQTRPARAGSAVRALRFLMQFDAQWRPA
ncbi:type VI secretion system baseplate subunit TssG [Massilia sp. W12]|uniref:type VI secretion system baseplate subunit TssG n=1 Tax=Massilia sp. W12 TaxID=3126507 RepID=UPI0030CA5FE8